MGANSNGGSSIWTQETVIVDNPGDRGGWRTAVAALVVIALELALLASAACAFAA